MLQYRWPDSAPLQSVVVLPFISVSRGLMHRTYTCNMVNNMSTTVWAQLAATFGHFVIVKFVPGSGKDQVLFCISLFCVYRRNLLILYFATVKPFIDRKNGSSTLFQCTAVNRL